MEDNFTKQVHGKLDALAKEQADLPPSTRQGPVNHSAPKERDAWSHALDSAIKERDAWKKRAIAAEYAALSSAGIAAERDEAVAALAAERDSKHAATIETTYEDDLQEATLAAAAALQKRGTTIEVARQVILYDEPRIIHLRVSTSPVKDLIDVHRRKLERLLGRIEGMEDASLARFKALLESQR